MLVHTFFHSQKVLKPENWRWLKTFYQNSNEKCTVPFWWKVLRQWLSSRSSSSGRKKDFKGKKCCSGGVKVAVESRTVSVFFFFFLLMATAKCVCVSVCLRLCSVITFRRFWRHRGPLSLASSAVCLPLCHCLSSVFHLSTGANLPNGTHLY